MSTAVPKKIFSSKSISDITLSATSNLVAFKSIDSDGRLSVLYYKKGMRTAVKVFNDQVFKESNFRLANIQGFNFNEDKLLMYLKSQVKPDETTSTSLRLRIWNYTDERISSPQKANENSKPYLAVIDFKKAPLKILQIQNPNEEVRKISGNYALIEVHVGDGGLDQINWNKASQHSFILRSLINGKTQQITANPFNSFVDISPKGDFVVYYDTEKKSFFSLCSLTGVIKNLTSQIPLISWGRDVKHDFTYSSSIPYPIAAWIKDGSVILNDGSDLWQISLTDSYFPICLTNFYGKKNNLYFEPIQDPAVEISIGDVLICNSLNISTKHSGFYQIIVGKRENPICLSEGPYFFYVNERTIAPIEGSFKPRKALKAQKYLVGRSSFNQSYNNYTTSNFKTFENVTDINPEKSYNWLTAQLHTWQSLNGDSLQGILYKPENFDPQKKYPLIVNFYEKRSDGLYTYTVPEYLNHSMQISIPYYVSNGYLVFSPDINYKVGDPMQGAYDAIISAARYLSKISFVDSTKLGIQSGSFGGFQTNYIITHTNVFAAACSAAGVSNITSLYGNQAPDGSDYKAFIEFGQIRMGKPLWEIPQLYIKNSPVFAAAQVTTPTLLMHTSIDFAVPFSQAFEMFTALRRLGKRAWLLEYGDGNHGLFDNSAKDFSRRMLQFFNFYLKNQPTPKWMLGNLPTNLRNGETGFELNSSGRRPGPGLLTEKEQKKIDEYSKIPLSEKLKE